MSKHSTKVSVTFDKHDLEQLVLLARLGKTTVQDLIRSIVRRHLDGR